MKRSKHTLSYYRMHTAGMGELFPVGCMPVLPGDTVQHHTSAVIRVTPLNTPVMHPVSVRIHHWYVPNRITWPVTENGGWEEFITGGPSGTNTQTPPQITATGDKKSLMAYLGVPPIAAGKSVTELPVRAVNLTWNRRYRDQDLQVERAANDNTVPRCAWEKDYFTTARPWASKGNPVTLPLGTRAPVKADVSSGANIALRNSDNPVSTVLMGTGGANLTRTANAGTGTDDLYADLAAASQIDINAFRAGFALQRYQEARSRYGSRFTEYLRYLGVTPSDARLQEPEFLGGGTARLNFSEVLQTTPASQGGTNGVGDLYGHGIAGARTNAYRKFIEEHGYIITLMSVRPKALYMNGLHREWRKTTKEDFYQRELVHLGQQEVKTEEVVGGASASSVFGFQDRYGEYREMPSLIGEDFRDVLNSWHLGRDLTGTPALNAAFVECKPADRIYQVTTNDPLWCMINHHVVARRLIPKRSNPRIL